MPIFVVLAAKIVLVVVIIVSFLLAILYLFLSSIIGSCCWLKSPKIWKLTSLRRVSDETYQFSPEPVWIELHDTVAEAREHFRSEGVDTRKLRSHNNLSAFRWLAADGGDDRFYFAYRIAPTHFPSKKARLIVFSTHEDPMAAREWKFEFEVHTGGDLREPQFIALAGELFFYWFTMESPRCWNFEPSGVFLRVKGGPGPEVPWSAPEQPTLGSARESFHSSTVPWDMKTHMGRAWLMIYTGDHYGVGDAMRVVFISSVDGRNWTIAGKSEESESCCYIGGACETAFEFRHGGTEVVAYSRNEDGDDKHGFGTVIMKGTRLGVEEPPMFVFEDCTSAQQAAKFRFDSPRMFTHGGHVYLVGRHVYHSNDIAWTKFLPLSLRKFFVLFMYSARPKATAVYRVADDLDLDFCCFVNPSNGDTAFPSVVPMGPGIFLITNYTSKLCDAAPWIMGQLNPTAIYMTKLTIGPAKGGEQVKPAHDLEMQLLADSGA